MIDVIDGTRIEIRPFVQGIPAVNEAETLIGIAMTAYERALQALRDVRHQLPPDGVALVDSVLNAAPPA